MFLSFAHVNRHEPVKCGKIPAASVKYTISNTDCARTQTPKHMFYKPHPH